jgi:hypothetical protein
VRKDTLQVETFRPYHRSIRSSKRLLHYVLPNLFQQGFGRNERIGFEGDYGEGRREKQGTEYYRTARDFNGTFIQILEGKEDDVLDTFDRIQDDSHHEQIIKLFSGNTDKRHFPNWKMSLQVLDESTFSNSYESLDDGDRFLKEVNDDHIGIKMLAYFYDMKKNQ